MKLPNFWQFFNLTSQPVIPSLYWDSYSYEERIKKICDKTWAIIRYLKYVMEAMNDFDKRLTVLEELYNELERRVTELETEVNNLKTRVETLERDMVEVKERVSELERKVREIYDLIDNLNDIIASEYDETETYVENDFVMYENKFYKCVSTTTGEFNSSDWVETQIGPELTQLLNAISSIPSMDELYEFFAEFYDETATYNEGDLCIYDGKFYIANTDISVAESFDYTHWDITSVDDIYKRLLSMISSSSYDDTLDLKLANESSTNVKINKFHPLVFNTDQYFNNSGNPNTDPYVVKESPILVANISDVYSGTDYLTPTVATESDHYLLLGTLATETIPYENKSYRIRWMFVANRRAIAFCINGSNLQNLIFSYDTGNGWTPYIGTYVKANDAASAQSLSASKLNTIYYVEES